MFKNDKFDKYKCNDRGINATMQILSHSQKSPMEYTYFYE